MPNHVENDLVIHGDPETLRAFVAYAEGPAGTSIGGAETELLSAQRFVPFPPEFQVRHLVCPICGYDAGEEPKDEAERYIRPECPRCELPCKDWFDRGGQEWCLEHWGTQWGIYETKATCADFEYGEISYTFLTAWSPPLPVIEAMAKLFPSLTFGLDYFEGGAGFMGSQVYEGGELVEGGSASYHGDRGG